MVDNKVSSSLLGIAFFLVIVIFGQTIYSLFYHNVGSVFLGRALVSDNRCLILLRDATYQPRRQAETAARYFARAETSFHRTRADLLLATTHALLGETSDDNQDLTRFNVLERVIAQDSGAAFNVVAEQTPSSMVTPSQVLISALSTERARHCFQKFYGRYQQANLWQPRHISGILSLLAWYYPDDIESSSKPAGQDTVEPISIRNCSEEYTADTTPSAQLRNILNSNTDSAIDIRPVSTLLASASSLSIEDGELYSGWRMLEWRDDNFTEARFLGGIDKYGPSERISLRLSGINTSANVDGSSKNQAKAVLEPDIQVDSDFQLYALFFRFATAYTTNSGRAELFWPDALGSKRFWFPDTNGCLHSGIVIFDGEIRSDPAFRLFAPGHMWITDVIVFGIQTAAIDTNKIIGDYYLLYPKR